MARSKPSSRDDHRAVVVELTPRGRALWREMNVTYRRALQLHVSGQLSEGDVGDLRRILGNLADGLGSCNGH